MLIANILHSGQMGDILYSLPAAKTFKKVNFFIKESKFMSKENIDIILPLLKVQSYINIAKKYEGERIDFDFDKFRESPAVSCSLPYSFLNLYQRYYNLAEPWIDNIEPITASKIIINRTLRYIGELNYRQIVKKYGNECTFIGLENEYEKFTKDFGKITFIKINNLLEMAQILKGSKIFIGNQSVCYAIAEGMKHPRILEVSPDCPNCPPIGKDGFSSWQEINLIEIVENYLLV